MSSPRILVIGSEPATVHAVNACLTRNSFCAEISQSCAAALAKICSDPSIPDVVLLALGNHQEGLQTLRRLQQLHCGLKIVVLCEAGANQHLIEAIRIGARDYVTLPFHDFQLLDVVKRHTSGAGIAETAAMESIEEVAGEHFFLSASTLMKKIRIQAELLANIDVPVLILGESGTGKEVIAQLIHKLSPRSDQRFLKVNCAALPGELLESELFGYERGAFTGATRTRAGKFELCEKGTILLDEIAEMPASLQPKLLHALQDKQFFRLGGENTVNVDVRVLAATNVDIQEALAQRRFRQDLYYRLSAFTIFLPPLRERREEIPVLLRHFMQRNAVQYSRRPLPFSPRLVNTCVQYAWPGNLRELQNFVRRYLVMGDENIALEELHGNKNRKVVFAGSPTRSNVARDGPGEERGPDLKDLLRTLKEEAEIVAISKALAQTDWNRKRAARLLHISYRGLLYKIRQHAITRAPVSQMAEPTVDVGLCDKYAKAAAAAIQTLNDKTDSDHLKPPVNSTKSSSVAQIEIAGKH